MDTTPSAGSRSYRAHLVRLLACGILCFLPAVSYALGLGRLVVHSSLDERLNAEIEVTAASPQEIKTLQAELASRAEFTAAGIERPPLLSTVKFAPVTRADGRSFVVLSTEQPVREPFLHFLLEVKWTGGRILREYTALLDPPNWVSARPAPVESPPVARVEASAPAPAASAAVPVLPDRPFGPPGIDIRDAAAPVDETTDMGARDGDWATVTQYGPIARGQTLSGIVNTIARDRSVSAEQAMLALLRANPQAFFENNINNLRAGHILKVPERSMVTTLDRAAALREARVQHDAWREYRMKLAGAARAVTATPTEEPAKGKPAAVAGSKQSAEKPAKPAEVQAEATPADLLRIVRAALDEKGPAEGSGVSTPASGGDAAGEQRTLRDKVATLEEALESKRLENKELQERVATLQGVVENTKRLIEIQNREAAIAQKGVAETRTEAATEAKAPAAAPSAPPAAPAAKPAARKPPAPPAAGFLDDLLGNAVTLGMLGTVIVLGGVILILYVRRRGQAKSEFAESILSGGTAGRIGEPVTAAGNKGADASFLSEFSKGGMGNIHHTDEDDPVAEAEVYLAYGRDEQAEEILKEAVAKDPARHELKLKLLEIYHQRNDLPAFETLAEELYAATEGKGGKVWAQVETMGRKMNPDNPMFRGGQAASTVVAAAETAAPAMASAAATAPAAQFAAAPPLSPPEFSFDLDLTGDTGEIPLDVAAPSAGADRGGRGPAPTPTAGETAAKETMVEFDSPFGKTEPADAFVEEEKSWPSLSEDRSIAFEAPSMPPPAGTAGEAPPAPGGTVSPDWDETATKLDLAKAYIDMGDADGARSILDEVMTEGSDLQKKQAGELIAQLG